MKPRIFLDTNIFIYAFEFPESNSGKVIDLLNENKIEGIISKRVLKETMKYFKKYYNKDLASLFRLYLLESCIFVLPEEVRKETRKFKGKIKAKDLEQLAVVKKKGIKYLVSYDEDFESFSEYYTPKEFIIEMDLEPSQTEY